MTFHLGLVEWITILKIYVLGIYEPFKKKIKKFKSPRLSGKVVSE